jgi:tRNA dimethylallyltransferase
MNTHTITETQKKIKLFLDQNPNGILEILGPTASGKTSLTVILAQWIEDHTHKKVEVIVVDSRQIYRYCDISAAKIKKEEMAEVTHWGLDLKNPDEPFSVYEFQQYAFEKIESIQKKHHIPLLSGGTMLWLDAISQNYVFSEKGAKSNRKGEPRWPVLKIGIEWDRKTLYDRINKRAVMQFENGLVAETKNILQRFKVDKNVRTSFGYQEIQAYLDGKISYEQALNKNQQRNRNYAKRQLTWWRGRNDIWWIDGKTMINGST